MIPSATDIVFAPASPLGLMGVVGRANGPSRAVIRLSGPGTFDLLDTLLAETAPRNRGIWTVRLRLHLAEFESSPTLVPSACELPCLLIAYPAPRSFTGQDSAELVLTANPIVVELVLAAIGSGTSGGARARPAEPGEFAARAFLAGRMSLTQAEGIAALIRAGTDEQVAAAKRVMSGEAGAAHRRLADELANLLALVEAGIDFTDQEDVVPIAPVRLRDRLERLRQEVLALLGGQGAKKPRDTLPVVVLVGRPNAGKSALFNALLGRPRSIVADLAGTTRDVIREEVQLVADPSGTGEAVRCVLCDLPGLDSGLVAGESQEERLRCTELESIESQARQGALWAIAHADVVIWCDQTGRFDERELAAWLAADGCPDSPGRASVIRVRTKADMPLLSVGCGGEAGSVGAGNSIAVSSIDGRNLDALRQAIADVVAGGTGDHAPGQAGVPGSAAGTTVVARHARALRSALAEIESALDLLPDDVGAARAASPELLAGHLRAGLDQFAELTGRISPDEVIGRVFATFCVGK